jgi:hypothetical protein
MVLESLCEVLSDVGRRQPALGRRPSEARRLTAQPEIGRSDSSPRVRSARSVTPESAMPVQAAMASNEIGYYSRR